MSSAARLGLLLIESPIFHRGLFHHPLSGGGSRRAKLERRMATDGSRAPSSPTKPTELTITLPGGDAVKVVADAGLSDSDLRMDVETNSTTKQRTKRTWVLIEDEALVECLVELCVGGHWKVDNGFRPGYLPHLEKLMQAKIPGCDLKASPHIESRVKTLKKQTLAITEMIHNSSGFSWNSHTNCIICEKDIFDVWVKSHPTAAGLRNKSFPHYKILVDIFGKDRANDHGSESIADVVEDLDRNPTSPVDQHDNPTNSQQYFGGPSTLTPPLTQSTTYQSPTMTGGKKKRKERANDGLVDLNANFGKFVDLTKQHIMTSQNHMHLVGEYLTVEKECLMVEKEQTLKRARAVAEVMKLTDLNDDDIFDASTMIADNEAKMEVFLGLPDSRKRSYIRRLLDQQRNATNSALFKRWLKNMQSETGLLTCGQMSLRQVNIQGVDMFGRGVGFLKFRADVFDKETGSKIPGIVFARGQSVAVLIILESGEEDYVVLTEQVRVPIGRFILELPAGMIDDERGDVVGAAVREVEEETGIRLNVEDMVDLTAFLDPATGCKIFPSPGGSDEELSLFLYRGHAEKETISALHGRELGLRDHGELIKVHVIPYDNLWRMTADMKALASITLYEMAKRDGLLPLRNPQGPSN